MYELKENEVEVDVLDYHKLTPEEFVEIHNKYCYGKNILAVRGDGYMHLFWNPKVEPNNISFDDGQIPKEFWEDSNTKMLIANLLKLEPSKLVIMYFEQDCEKYIKQYLDKPIKKKWHIEGKTELIG